MPFRSAPVEQLVQGQLMYQGACRDKYFDVPESVDEIIGERSSFSTLHLDVDEKCALRQCMLEASMPSRACLQACAKVGCIALWELLAQQKDADDEVVGTMEEDVPP